MVRGIGAVVPSEPTENAPPAPIDTTRVPTLPPAWTDRTAAQTSTSVPSSCPTTAFNSLTLGFTTAAPLWSAARSAGPEVSMMTGVGATACTISP